MTKANVRDVDENGHREPLRCKGAFCLLREWKRVTIDEVAILSC